MRSSRLRCSSRTEAVGVSVVLMSILSSGGYLEDACRRGGCTIGNHPESTLIFAAGAVRRKRGYTVWDIRGRPGFDVVGSPAELQAEVPEASQNTGKNASADKNRALALAA